MHQSLSWRIHVGVHKTATTHLQDTLALQRGALSDAGVSFVSRDDGRAHKLGRTLCGLGRRKFLPTSWRRKQLEKILLTFGNDQSEIVFSDENILGPPTHLIAPVPFPDLEVRLKSLTHVVGDDQLRVYLSIRNPADLLPSIWAQLLRAGPPAEDLKRLKERWLASPPDWLSLIRRVKAGLPSGSVSVWTMEGYSRTPDTVIQHFTGSDAAHDLGLPAPSSTQRPSAEVIAKFEALPHKLKTETRRAINSQMAHDDTGTTAFEVFTHQEKEKLDQHYQASLSEIESLGVKLIC